MSLLRVTAQRVAAPAFARTFSVSAARADLVKDLYVNQLKAYKVPAKAADAHAGAVRQFSAPAAPVVPALPTDLAAELSKFDATEPTLGGSAPAAKAEGAADGQSAEQYLAFLEEDLPKKDAHH
ncbi:uncharacterized protein EHS24_000198 [Apiotrichum porosum]|uniref:ATP synthase F0 subcomplex subunit H atp14 n=1 Tax=Apiotrichum porosum TaxID=105984 RepID=A0A427Y9L5_9TREE|nr:uncharacterized protein EHS24_000198 [Apiotrichum porosum]RSH87684.1 hypothetical protein EHS24_000198 [Apiotrichum porosum]